MKVKPGTILPATDRQLVILDFIVVFFVHNGYWPTYQEIGNGCGMTKKGAFDHCQALTKKELLVSGPADTARGRRPSAKYEIKALRARAKLLREG